MGANTSSIGNSKSPVPVEGGDSRDTGLTGRTLTIARLVWVTISILFAGQYIWAISLWNLSEDDIPFNILMPLGCFVIGLIIFWRKYDAQQALAIFAATARDEVDMETLTTTLLDVVEETIQPERVSLWLRAGEEK